MENHVQISFPLGDGRAARRGRRPLAAAIVGADAAVCTAGKPSVLVHVAGLQAADRQGQTVGLWQQAVGCLKKEGRLRRIKVPVRSRGPVDVCMPVPAPGPLRGRGPP